MTRKDYIRLAGALCVGYRASCNLPQRLEGVQLAAGLIAQTLTDDNPHFNSEHFPAVVRGERRLTSRPPRKPIHPDALVRDDSQG